jgi:hypothetical protein
LNYVFLHNGVSRNKKDGGTIFCSRLPRVVLLSKSFVTDYYYDLLLRFLDHAAKEEFVRPANVGPVQVARNSAEALQWIREQRNKISLNQDIGGQNGGGLKP